MKTEIYLDGKFLGYTENPQKYLNEVIKRRREGKLPYSLNVCYYKDLNAIHLLTEGGRVRRPLIVVENGKSKLTKEHIEKLKSGEWKFSDLIKNGIIEFLDAEEEENAYIAVNEDELTEEHTHLEISPSLIFGFSASLLVFQEFDRGDRVNYGAKMNNQAIGLFLRNLPIRTDTKANFSIYTQKPLIQSHLQKAYPKLLDYSNGFNTIVAIASYDGFNMDDAIVINQTSIERGLFLSYMFRTYTVLQKVYMGGQIDEIKIPEPGIRGYKGVDAYKKLEEDGIVALESFVTSDDAIVGKVSPIRFLGSKEAFLLGLERLKDGSETIREGDKGYVDKVFVMRSSEGTKLIKVRVRDLKIPEIGDKFANRHGQKGVVGLIVSQQDMPFTKDGIVPDIIFNPHGLPSRMTVGMLLEMLMMKAYSLKGEFSNVVPFEKIDTEELKEILVKFGFKRTGKEIMYNGITGEKFESEIYIAPCYYQKLDHLVSNKIHARSRGPVTLLTRQPTEGRSREGGLRLGEMEKDVLLAHGAVITLKERFDSDKTIVPVCSECGSIAIESKFKNKKYCLICGDSKIVDVEMSYSFKLMLDELKAMHIFPRIIIREEDED